MSLTHLKRQDLVQLPSNPKLVSTVECLILSFCQSFFHSKSVVVLNPCVKQSVEAYPLALQNEREGDCTHYIIIIMIIIIIIIITIITERRSSRFL